jgi:AcrR family transcriptional regulator
MMVEAHPDCALTPRGDARRRAFLEAAGALFLERGYGGVSMQDIVRQTGGSLATMYRCFGSKEGLFEAIVAEIAEDIVAPLLDESLDKLPAAEALQRLGEHFLERMLDPTALGWHRMVVAEGARHPPLREALFRRGPGRVRELLAAYLVRQAAAAHLEIANPVLAAEHFFGLVKAGVHMPAVCGEPITLDPAAVRQHVAAAVSVFLHGYAAPPKRDRREES